jgi:hypothetical protein
MEFLAELSDKDNIFFINKKNPGHNAPGQTTSREEFIERFG